MAYTYRLHQVEKETSGLDGSPRMRITIRRINPETKTVEVGSTFYDFDEDVFKEYKKLTADPIKGKTIAKEIAEEIIDWLPIEEARKLFEENQRATEEPQLQQEQEPETNKVV